MIQAGPVLEELYAALDATDPDRKKRARRTLNLGMFDLAQAASWEELRRTLTSVDHEDYLPADLVGIDGVYNSDNIAYLPRERYNVILGADDGVKRYYIKSVVSSALASGNDASVQQGSTAVTFGTAPSGTIAGEYIVFGKSLGVWKLATATTLTTLFTGENMANGPYRIRPEGTKQIGLMDENGIDDDSAVTVEYWCLPRPVESDGDMIPFPSTEVVLLKALHRHFKIEKRDIPRAEAIRMEYDAALADALSRNPRRTGPAQPLNRHAQAVGWGASRR